MQVRLRGGRQEVIQVRGPLTVRQLAKQLDLDLESHLFVREGRVLTPDVRLGDDDQIEVYRAISGGTRR